jgi:3-oxoacyl-[acyl-carrier-protein] synthase II
MQAWGAGPGGGGGMSNLQPLWMLKYLPNMLACHVTIIHGSEGPSNTITCGEASGLLSLGESMRVIQRGAADLCFSGGAESKINLMGMLRQTLSGRLAPVGDAAPAGHASHAVRPFDPASTGTVPGEAGAILMLEELSGARARGVRMYAEVVGFGAAQSTPTLPGEARADAGRANDGLALAIRAALADAKLGAGQIDAIVPHGLGVAAMDASEALALREVFGDSLATIPLVTLAPYVGDCWAGHGGVQAAVAAMMLKEQRVPARLQGGAPAIGLGAGPSDSQARPLRHVLACCSSIGGQNAAVIVRRIESSGEPRG